jgi:RNA polymerase sigma-70 factor (ECF subfamily)
VSDSLLERVANGDMGAMQACIDEYGGLVWSLARRFSASPAEAEDAVQEAFISLWENAARFDPAKGAEVTFVAMIARRRLIDRGRRYERRERLVTEAKEEARAHTSTTDDAVVNVDEARSALDAMEKLSEDQQRVLGLAIHQGCTHEQIARITEMPLGTVKTHARRGLLRIRDLLSETHEDESVGSTS